MNKFFILLSLLLSLSLTGCGGGSTNTEESLNIPENVELVKTSESFNSIFALFSDNNSDYSQIEQKKYIEIGELREGINEINKILCIIKTLKVDSFPDQNYRAITNTDHCQSVNDKELEILNTIISAKTNSYSLYVFVGSHYILAEINVTSSPTTLNPLGEFTLAYKAVAPDGSDLPMNGHISISDLGDGNSKIEFLVKEQWTQSHNNLWVKFEYRLNGIVESKNLESGSYSVTTITEEQNSAAVYKTVAIEIKGDYIAQRKAGADFCFDRRENMLNKFSENYNLFNRLDGSLVNHSNHANVTYIDSSGNTKDAVIYQYYDDSRTIGSTRYNDKKYSIWTEDGSTPEIIKYNNIDFKVQDNQTPGLYISDANAISMGFTDAVRFKSDGSEIDRTMNVNQDEYLSYINNGEVWGTYYRKVGDTNNNYTCESNEPHCYDKWEFDYQIPDGTLVTGEDSKEYVLKTSVIRLDLQDVNASYCSDINLDNVNHTFQNLVAPVSITLSGRPFVSEKARVIDGVIQF